MRSGSNVSEKQSEASTSVAAERTLWIIGSTSTAFANVRPVVDAVLRRFPRISVICTSRDPALVPDLPGAVRTRVPSALPLVAARTVRSRNPRLVLLLDGVTTFEGPLLRAARGRQIPVALVASGRGSLDGAPPRLLDLVDGFVPLDDEAAADLRAVPGIASRVAPASDAPVERDADAAADALLPLLRRDLKSLRSEQRPWGRRLERLAVATVDHSLIGRIATRRAVRLARVQDLAARLGHPRTILCLGNGPSSEDPRLRDVAYDALFRVNHLWQDRGFLTDPDVVFTGSTDTVRRMDRAIIAASSIRHEGRILLTGFTRRALRRFEFFTVERFGVLPPEPWWGAAVPTNGALMLATAVALRPERIVVAGMDLFRHERGAYPGDTSTANAYTSRHESDVEERILLTTLERHRGEVVIVGEILRALWGARPTAATGRAPVVMAPDGCAIGS